MNSSLGRRSCYDAEDEALQIPKLMTRGSLHRGSPPEKIRGTAPEISWSERELPFDDERVRRGLGHTSYPPPLLGADPSSAVELGPGRSDTASPAAVIPPSQRLGPKIDLGSCAGDEGGEMRVRPGRTTQPCRPQWPGSTSALQSELTLLGAVKDGDPCYQQISVRPLAPPPCGALGPRAASPRRCGHRRPVSPPLRESARCTAECPDGRPMQGGAPCRLQSLGARGGCAPGRPGSRSSRRSGSPRWCMRGWLLDPGSLERAGMPTGGAAVARLVVLTVVFLALAVWRIRWLRPASSDE